MESYDDDLIDDDEFILLYEANTSRNPEFPYEEYGRFDLDEMDDTECKAEFRFGKTHILLLAEALGIPEKFTCSQGTTSDGIEGIYLVLPLSLLWFDPSLWTASTGAEHDKQRSFRFHLQRT